MKKVFGFTAIEDANGKVTAVLNEKGERKYPYILSRRGGYDNASGWYTVKQIRYHVAKSNMIFR